MGDVVPFKRPDKGKPKQHEWVPSTLNHGTLQCRWCKCTDREAKYALGMECPG